MRIRELEQRLDNVLGGRLNILYLDDETSTLEILKLTMESERFPEVRQLETYVNPADALDRLKTERGKELRDRIHMVLADLALPREDGGEPTREVGMNFLREVDALPIKPRVLVYSGDADGLNDEGRENLQGLAYEVVIKSQSDIKVKIREAIPDCIDHWKRRVDLVEAELSEGLNIPPNQLNVLLVDDDPQVLKSTRRGMDLILKHASSNIHAFGSAEEAQRALEDTEFHLALCDVNIGSHDTGIELLEAIRNRQPEAWVVAFSGEDDSSDLRWLTRDFIVKGDPYNFEKIRQHRLKAAQHWSKVLEERRIEREKNRKEAPKSPFGPKQNFGGENLIQLNDRWAAKGLERVRLPLFVSDADGTILEAPGGKLMLADWAEELLEREKDPEIALGFKVKWLEKIIEDDAKYREALLNGGRYEDGEVADHDKMIDATTKYWGKACEGVEIQPLRQLGKSCIERYIKNPEFLYPHTRPMFEEADQFNLYNTLVSGMPQELLEPLMEYLPIDFVFGMELRTKLVKKEDGTEVEICDGTIKHATGTRATKEGILRLLEREHTAVAAFANANSDEALLDAGITSTDTHSLHGGALLYTPSEKDHDGFGSYRGASVSRGDLIIIERKSEAETTVRTFRHMLEDVVSSKRNLRKIRDINIAAGMTVEQAVKVMSDYLGAEKVQAAIRINPTSTHEAVFRDLLEEIGASPQEVDSLTSRLKDHQEEKRRARSE
ncbi:MAG: response regulator [Candidatus Peregrinibacteria bacterium]|nr:response regulator [Candidatus Peregrinibacteria bacterium]